MEREKLTRLVTGAQAGDPDAMDALFGEFYNEVYYFALKTTKNEDVACDVTQETFLRVIESIGSLKEPVAFVTWLRQITYHQCTRHFAKKTEVQVEEDEDGNSVFDTLADEGAIPAEILEKEEFRQTIMGMIEQLSEEQRAAVLLYYYDELSVGQIAQIQGVSEGTVKSRLNYARKAIKKSVEGYEKKHNIKLHSFAFLPLFMLFFGKAVMPEAKAAAVRSTVMASAKAAAAAGAGVGTGVAAAATKGSVLGAIAKLPVVTKVVAGVLAGVLVTGVSVGTVVLVNQNKDEEIKIEDWEESGRETVQIWPEETTETKQPERPERGKYEAYGLILHTPSLEYRDVFESYVNNKLFYVLTKSGGIINLVSDEMFPVIENVQKVWCVRPISRLIYQDNNGEYFVLNEEKVYHCPGVEGTPYYMDFGEFGDGIIFILDYYDDQGRAYYCRYSAGEGNELVLEDKTETSLWDETNRTQVIGVDEIRPWTYYDCSMRATVFDQIGLSGGKVYKMDGRQVVKDTGIRAEDLLTGPEVGTLIYKGETPEEMKIMLHPGHIETMRMPEGKTTDQIDRIVGSFCSGLIIFRDGQVYQYDVTDRQYCVTYEEQLTELYRTGAVVTEIMPDVGHGLCLIMDDGLTYSREEIITNDVMQQLQCPHIATAE